jgi:HK97 family phage major capsid protein
MDPLEKMRAELKQLVAEMRSIVELTNQEKREMTDGESTQFQTLTSRAENLRMRIDHEMTVRRFEDQGEVSRDEPIKPIPGDGEDRAVYGQSRRFRSLGEQLTAVMKAGTPGGVVDPRLSTRATGLNEAVPSEGGFLVQQDFATVLIERAFETGLLPAKCRKVTIKAGSNGIKIPTVNETSRADGGRWGGVQMYWKGEGAAKTPTKPAFRMMDLDLKKLVGLCYATDEMIEDAAALEEIIIQAFSEEMGFKLDDAIINGTGAGQPLGILNSGALVSVAIETGQPAATLQPENIIKMWSRCHGRSRLNALWLINQDIEPQLFTLGIAIGTGGSTVYMPPGGLSGQPYGTLFGRPIVPIEQCATLGTLGDIILFDPNQYALADKNKMQTASSIHVQFIYDETVFRFVYRVDGQPMWTSVLTPYKGTANTQSPYVALAARP